MLRASHVTQAVESEDYSPRVMVAVKNENGEQLGLYPALAAMPGTHDGNTDGTMVIIIRATDLRKMSGDENRNDSGKNNPEHT